GRGGRPRRAFVKGLATGLFVAALAIGAKVYVDRAGLATAPKSQDSLRAQKEDREERIAVTSGPETERAKSVQPNRPEAATDMSGQQENAAPLERMPDAGSPQSQTAAAQEGTKPEPEPRAGPARSVPAETMAAAQPPA